MFSPTHKHRDGNLYQLLLLANTSVKASMAGLEKQAVFIDKTNEKFAMNLEDFNKWYEKLWIKT